MRMRLVCMSAWATSRSGEGCGSQGAVWCSPIQASLKPSSSAQRSTWRSHWCPSKSFRSGGCDGIVNSPWSMAYLLCRLQILLEGIERPPAVPVGEEPQVGAGHAVPVAEDDVPGDRLEAGPEMLA